MKDSLSRRVAAKTGYGGDLLDLFAERLREIFGENPLDASPESRRSHTRPASAISHSAPPRTAGEHDQRTPGAKPKTRE